MYKPRIAFLVTHGTDTMAWGLAYLTYAIKRSCFPIGMVGSQIPMTEQYSDGFANVKLAVTMLTRLAQPLVFVAFDNGRKVYARSLQKVDKWDIDAFMGNVVAQYDSNRFLYIETARTRLAPIDRLYLLRTGGTIEASQSDGKYNAGRAEDVVARYIKDNFTARSGTSSGEVKSVIPVAPGKIGLPPGGVDSSDMTLDKWERVASAIVALARACPEDIDKIDALSGQLNDSHACYRPTMDGRFDDGVRVIYATPFTSAEGYLRAAEHASGVILLGYGAGNTNIEEEGAFSPMGMLRFIAGQSLSGNYKFAVLSSHAYRGIIDSIYENGARGFEDNEISKILMPSADFSVARSQVKLGFILGHMDELSERFSGNDALRMVKILFLSGARFASKDSKAWFERHLNVRIPEHDLLINRSFDEAVEKALSYLGKPERRFFIIPDRKIQDMSAIQGNYVVIVQPSPFVGESIEGAPLDGARSLANILLKSFEWKVVNVKLFEKDVSLTDNKLLQLLQNAAFVFWESIYPYDARSQVTRIIEKLMDRALQLRVEGRFPPSIFIGTSAFEFLKAVVRRTELSMETLKLNHFGSERNTGKIMPFEPDEALPDEEITAYKSIAGRFRGIVEHVVELEKTDVPLLFEQPYVGDTDFLVKLNYRLAAGGGNGLPLGLEITSVWADHPQGIASFAVYYRSPGIEVQRDLAFMFHPEIIGAEQVSELFEGEDVPVSLSNDGVKLLIAGVLSSLN